MPNELSDDDKLAIRSYVAEATTDEEKKARRKECAALYEVSGPTINAITAWTKIWKDKAKDALTPVEPSSVEPETSVTEAPPVIASEPETPVIIEPTITTAEPGLGEHYNNETKEKWFNEWLKFILDRTTPEWRAQAKVLTLAGPLCLRLPTYIAAGFKSEHIMAVEGGSNEEKATFEKNCPPGVQKRLKRLENFIAKEETRFDVVDYDFVGYIHTSILEILRETPFADRAFVLVNLLGTREQERSQSLIFNSYENIFNNRQKRTLDVFYQKGGSKADRRKLYERRAQKQEEIARKESRQVAEKSEDICLSSARADVITGIVLGTLQHARSMKEGRSAQILSSCVNHWAAIREADIQSPHINDIMFLIMSSCSLLKNLILTHMQRNGATFNAPKYFDQLEELMLMGSFEDVLVQNLRKIKYNSEKKGLPYYSVLAEIHSFQPMREQCSHALEFLQQHCEKHLSLLAEAKKEGLPNPVVQLSHKRNLMSRFMPTGGKKKDPVGIADTLVLSYNGVRSHEIKAGVFFREIDAFFQSVLKKWPLTASHAQKNLPWEEITS